MAGELKLRVISSNFSLKEEVYERLRDAITRMDIYGADSDLRLDERGLAEKLAVSRTPLREAIARLAAEGLVAVVPRKGVFVLRKSLDEILEMIVAWAALESMAARLAADRATGAEIASLRKVASSCKVAEVADSGSWIAEYSDTNIRFHLRILEMSGCAILKSMAESLFLHMRAVRLRAMGEADRAKRSVVDHAGIIEALEARDADLAALRVREHTMRLHDHVRKTWTRLEHARKGPAEGSRERARA